MQMINFFDFQSLFLVDLHKKIVPMHDFFGFQTLFLVVEHEKNRFGNQFF